ncbi:bS18 family ribosomal protein [Streptomyces sp. MS2.AVA.5]|uniref:BS18 family ribosomal protein n=1 Tax=Streptomyces achmelvichensis TaxID=3134111 RepID=A0ACC6Q7J9_9ACTN
MCRRPPVGQSVDPTSAVRLGRRRRIGLCGPGTVRQAPRKIRGRRVTRVTAQQQRKLDAALKNAREMALLPYGSR